MHEHEFLQWHEILTVFDHSPLLERYVDAYGSEGFDAAKRAADAMVVAIESNATPKEKKQSIHNETKSIDKKSTYGARYLPPTNKDAYSNACANVLTELKAKVIRSSKKEVIVVEEETKKQLSKKASEEHFPSTSEILPVLNDDGSVAAALYKYTVDDTTFRILVTTSWHTIRGHLKTLLAIMNNGQSFLSFGNECSTSCRNSQCSSFGEAEADIPCTID